MHEGKGCHTTKADMKSAFRNLPIKPDDWCLLVMFAFHPVTGVKYFFVDKCLFALWGKHFMFPFPEVFKQYCFYLQGEDGERS